jgi:hypothetical protein
LKKIQRVPATIVRQIMQSTTGQLWGQHSKNCFVMMFIMSNLYPWFDPCLAHQILIRRVPRKS